MSAKKKTAAAFKLWQPGDDREPMARELVAWQLLEAHRQIEATQGTVEPWRSRWLDEARRSLAEASDCLTTGGATADACRHVCMAWMWYGAAADEAFLNDGKKAISRQNSRNARPDPTRGKAAAKAAILAEWAAMPAAEKAKRGAGAKFDRAMHDKHRGCIEPNSVKKWREECARAAK